MYQCEACGREYGPREAWRCACGHALDYAETPLPDGGPLAFSDLDERDGLWAFSEFLPMERRVSLGEGWTPLVDAPEWDASFKLEYLFPTASFKDRGATTTLSQAVDLGVERVVEDSSGNAGAAIATYAARAGLDAEIYVPADAKPAKLRAIERAGADVVRVEGDRQAVTDACVERVVDDEGGWYASHAWNPAFFAGTATFAYEVAAQRDWSVPDVVVTPLGHGTLFLGAYRGFAALAEAGWTDRIPRLVGVQAAGVAPLADGTDASSGRNDAADGIQIRQPARERQIRAALDATGGEVLAISRSATDRAHARLGRGGFQVEPTSAVAVAGLRELRERGRIDQHADVVVPLTGSGMKG
ncbi:pyridoxal-phosphate dependent enzyme [Haloarculaceae archaeon H-GB2-1]|nr:pyridoxal-phosphate dependent enzyme [Haloarculaceae archaeon H-GB1-1]MEA5385708.1 pyridoxal-phosphate dependent enzyme [Haloarculaceae archaeon H-GB11]MEA5407209.1 pyridoxal-phosphate dependent enzyme [Haloarculaceae archaeon H-GB2-1]